MKKCGNFFGRYKVSKWLSCLSLLPVSFNLIADSQSWSYVFIDETQPVTFERPITSFNEHNLNFEEYEEEEVANNNEEKINNSPSDGEKRLWNLENVDIRVLIDQMAKETQKNFLIDPGVSGRVTLVSTVPIDSATAYEMFLTSLQSLGLTIIESNGVDRIIQDANAKHLSSTIIGDNDIDIPNESVVVQVVPVYNVAAPAMVPVLRNLISPRGHLAAYAGSNVMIIADHASNVQRLSEIIHRIDSADRNGIDHIRLENSSASQLAQSLQAIANARSAGDPVGGQVYLAADDRTNTIIMSGNEGRRLELKALIISTDSIVDDEDEGNTQVIYLRYQKAEDMVYVLGSIIQSYVAQQQQSQLLQSSSSISGPTALQAASSSNNSNNSTSVGGDSPLGLDATERQAVGQNFGSYSVYAEPNTNALVISSPPSLMRQLRNVIARLDVRRAQVLVEAIVAEVNENDLLNLGVEWETGSNGRVIGGTNYGNNTVSALTGYANGATDSSGNLLGFPAGGLSLGFIKEGSFSAVLNALATNTNANILSTPSLVTLDNSEAVISVGETRPLLDGTVTTPSGTAGGGFDVSEQYRYEQVGLTLIVRPQIAGVNQVFLDINQKVDDFTTSTTDLLQVTTNREIKTSVLVDNSDILVLGGLIKTNEYMTQNKVPILGDIPLLGVLFRSESMQREKNNLMIFIRPTILRDQNDGVLITSNKYDYIQAEQSILQGKQNVFGQYSELTKLPNLPADEQVEYITQPIELPVPTF